MLIVLAFVGIYIVRTVVSVAVQGVSDGSGMQHVKEWAAMFKNPMMWLNIAALPINYFFVFIAFFWRRIWLEILPAAGFAETVRTSCRCDHTWHCMGIMAYPG